jgi:hypothetical protein
MDGSAPSGFKTSNYIGMGSYTISTSETTTTNWNDKAEYN